jgi:hypothetical protein
MNPRTLIQWSFALNASLVIILIIATGNSSLLQAPADAIFGSFVQNVQLRVYLFDALVFGMSFVVSYWAVNGIHKHGYHQGLVENEV